jgi:hypothetical protein
MHLNFTITSIALTLFLTITSCAQSKRASVEPAKGYAKLIEATSQRSIPGIRDAEIETIYKFIVIWQANEQPLDFFWKAPGIWQHCAVSKVHKTMNKSANGAGYRTEAYEPGKLRKGDTLELVPVKGGKYPIPTEIPSDLNNVVIFKTNKTNWLQIPVGKITRKPDVIMH